MYLEISSLYSNIYCISVAASSGESNLPSVPTGDSPNMEESASGESCNDV